MAGILTILPSLGLMVVGEGFDDEVVVVVAIDRAFGGLEMGVERIVLWSVVGCVDFANVE